MNTSNVPPSSKGNTLPRITNEDASRRLTTFEREAQEYQKRTGYEPGRGVAGPSIDSAWHTVRWIGLGMMAVGFLVINTFSHEGGDALGTTAVEVFIGGVVIYLIGWIGVWYVGQARSFFSFSQWGDALGPAGFFCYMGLIGALNGDVQATVFVWLVSGLIIAAFLIRKHRLMDKPEPVKPVSHYMVAGVRRDNGEEHREVVAASSRAFAQAKGEQMGLIVVDVKPVP